MFINNNKDKIKQLSSEMEALKITSSEIRERVRVLEETINIMREERLAMIRYFEDKVTGIINQSEDKFREYHNLPTTVDKILNTVSVHEENLKELRKVHDQYSLYLQTLKDKHNDIVSFLGKHDEVIKQLNKIFLARPTIPPKIRVQILKRDNNKCVWCGRGKEDGVTLHVDHIVPVRSAEGMVMSNVELNDPSNLRTLCNECNLGKSNNLDDELDL